MERFDLSPIKINHLAFKLSKSGCMMNSLGSPFKTRAQAMRAIMDYIGYDNTERRHSWLRDVSLTQAEGDAVVMSLDSYNCNIETLSCC
jgi:hypothetical protein